MSGTDRELERLREIECRLRSITEHAPDYIIEFDRAGTVLYMNRPPPGWDLEQAIGCNVRDLMEPQFHAAFDRTLTEVFETARLSSYESVGSVIGRYYINRVSPVVIDGAVDSAILITHDITELKQAEKRLREAEARHRALMEASFEGLCISVDRVFIVGNQAVADMFGYEPDELVGMSPTEMATPESAALVKLNVEAGLETPYEITCVRKDGTTFPCELRGRNIEIDGKPGRITGFRDLTEQRAQDRREDRVRHAQKLETLGVLAGGIAHDFNNLLAVMLTNTELALRGRDDPAQVEHSLQQVHSAVLRARDLTAQLLVYAGRGERQIQRVDLSELIRDAVDLFGVSISKKATLALELAPELPRVEADVGQVRQILMNLIINASEALDGEGTITIATGEVDADRRYLHDSFGDADLEPGRYVYVDVRDTGTGMTAATLSRIFDPFFTTKFAGRGLGLAAVQGIVRAHDGAIKVSSSPGEGTSFRVMLPAAMAAAEPAGEPQPLAVHPHAGATILLAEDEGQLARALQATLEGEGYRVFHAADGARAVELYREHSREIGLALLDMTMPEKDGLEVLAEIRAICTAVPVILSSGYADQRFQDVVDADPNLRFLAKPYGIGELLELIGSTLGDRLEPA